MGNTSRVLLKVLGILVLGSVSARQLRVQETDWLERLSGTFDLSRNLLIGEKHRYRMQTVYFDMNDSGRVANTRILEGFFTRETMQVEKAKFVDRICWDCVKMGSCQGKDVISEMIAVIVVDKLCPSSFDNGD